MLTTNFWGALAHEWALFCTEFWRGLVTWAKATYLLFKLLRLLVDGAYGLFFRGPKLLIRIAPNLPPKEVHDCRHRIHGTHFHF